jgi:hypothetical protein
VSRGATADLLSLVTLVGRHAAESREHPKSTQARGRGRCEDVGVWSPHPQQALPQAFNEVAETLDPIVVPLGFAPGQSGASEDTGQVLFCRGDIDSIDGACVDLVIDLEAKPSWRISDVRYWGFPSETWHLAFLRDADLREQLAELARTLPVTLALRR